MTKRASSAKMAANLIIHAPKERRTPEYRINEYVQHTLFESTVSVISQIWMINVPMVLRQKGLIPPLIFPFTHFQLKQLNYQGTLNDAHYHIKNRKGAFSIHHWGGESDHLHVFAHVR